MRDTVDEFPRDGNIPHVEWLWAIKTGGPTMSGTGNKRETGARRAGAEIIEIDPKYFRPNEVDFLLGDPAKARKHLGWKQTTGFESLITEMVESDLGTMMREARRNDLFSH